MTQSVRSHTGPAALIKLAQDVLNTEIAGLAAVRDRLNARTPEKAHTSLTAPIIHFLSENTSIHPRGAPRFE